MGEETLLQKGPSPTKHFKKKRHALYATTSNHARAVLSAEVCLAYTRIVEQALGLVFHNDLAHFKHIAA